MKKPPFILRLISKFLSVILCVILGISLIGTIVIADLNTLTSSGGIQQMITSIFKPAKAPQSPHIAVGTGGVLPEGFDVSQLGPGLFEDLLSSMGDSNAITDILFDTMQDMMGEDVPITTEQLKTFVEESNVTEFVAEKAGGFVEDMLNGTENTMITTEELIQLVEDNKTLIEETFEITISEEKMEEIKTNVTDMMAEQDINTTIRTEINKATESATELLGVSISQVMQVVQMLSEDTTLYCAIGLCVALVLLLMLANFYNIPGGMTWASLPCLLVGAVAAAPIALVQFAPESLGGLASYGSMLTVLAPAHYTVFLAGVVLLVGSIVWRIVRLFVRKDKD